MDGLHNYALRNELGCGDVTWFGTRLYTAGKWNSKNSELDSTVAGNTFVEVISVEAVQYIILTAEIPISPHNDMQLSKHTGQWSRNKRIEYLELALGFIKVRSEL